LLVAVAHVGSPPDEPLFQIVDDEQVGEHRFLRIAPVAPDRLAADLAPRITVPYFNEDLARDRIIRAARELDLFAGETLTEGDPRLEEAIAAERDAVLPAAWGEDRPRQLDVQRSEFGEIVAADVLSNLFGTRIPASRIAHKETPDQQARGADVLGWEGAFPALVLVISEVKGSTEGASPPSVITAMEKKLRTLLEDRRALLQELIWLRDYSSDDHAEECAAACASFQLRAPAFTTLLAPILVRTASKVGSNDAGAFRDASKSFGSPIRFISIVVEQDLFDLAADVYRRARGRQ
jgi:hypothetical protein